MDLIFATFIIFSDRERWICEYLMIHTRFAEFSKSRRDGERRQAQPWVRGALYFAFQFFSRSFHRGVRKPQPVMLGCDRHTGVFGRTDAIRGICKLFPYARGKVLWKK